MSATSVPESNQAQWAYYLAYPSSNILHNSALDYLDSIRNNPQKAAAPILIDVMQHYIPETLEAYLKKPTDLVGIGATAQKIVNVSTATMSKTASSLTKQVLKKTPNRDLAGITEHIDSMVLNAEDTERGIPLSAIRIPDALYDKSMAMIQRMQEQPPSEYHDEVVELLLELTDAIAEEVMRKPIGLMPMGPIVKKMANLGMDTTVAAALKVVKGVFAKMNDNELLEASKYFDELLVKSKKGI